MRSGSAVIVALLLAACADADAPEEPEAAPSPGFRIEETGTEPAGPRVEPSVVLVSDRSEAEVAAANAPAAGAAEAIRAWDGFEERALLVVYVGTVPDAGTSVRIDDVSLDGRLLTVSATLVARDPAAQVISIAWAVASVDADLAARAETCRLALEDREPPETACSPTIPYASK